MNSKNSLHDRFGSRSRSRSPFRKNFSERPSKPNNNKNFQSSKPGPKGFGRTKRVLVLNIPFGCKWADLKDVFRSEVGEVAFVEMSEDVPGMPKGRAYIEFKSPNAAEKAVEKMNNYEMGKRKLTVVLEDNARPNKSQQLPPRNSGEQRRNPNIPNREPPPRFNTYGLNPDFLKSLSINGPLTNKVFISNLDFKATEEKLADIFKIAGKISEVKLLSNGKTKGTATVAFNHPLEAVQAISMFHGQRLFARIMNVRMDKFADEDPSPKLPPGLHGIGKGLGMRGTPMQFDKNAADPPNRSFGMGDNHNSMPRGGMESAMISDEPAGFGRRPDFDLERSGVRGMGRFDSGRRNSGFDLDRSDSSIRGSDFGMERAEFGMGRNDMGLGRSDLGMERSNMGMGRSDMGMERSSMGMERSSMGMGRSDMGMGRSDFDLDRSDRGMGRSDLGMPRFDADRSDDAEFGVGRSGMGRSRSDRDMSPLGGMYSNNSRDGRMGRDGPPGEREGMSFKRRYEEAEGFNQMGGSDTIIVKNIPNANCWTSLKMEFQDIGGIRFAEIQDRGQDRGNAIIRYHLAQDAHRAIDLLNGYRIDGHTIQVQYY